MVRTERAPLAGGCGGYGKSPRWSRVGKEGDAEPAEQWI